MKKSKNAILSNLVTAFAQVSSEALRVAKFVVSQFVFDEIEAAENLEESAHLGEAWERENYLKYQTLAFKVIFFVALACH